MSKRNKRIEANRETAKPVRRVRRTNSGRGYRVAYSRADAFNRLLRALARENKIYRL